MQQAAKEFCEEDIDKIMSERTHRIVVEAPGKTASWLSKKTGGLKKKVLPVVHGCTGHLFGDLGLLMRTTCCMVTLTDFHSAGGGQGSRRGRGRP